MALSLFSTAVLAFALLGPQAQAGAWAKRIDDLTSSGGWAGTGDLAWDRSDNGTHAALESLDPEANRDWRPSLPGAYRTGYGAQFDASCTPFDEDSYKRKVDETLNRIARGLLNCRSRYPELDSLILPAITSLRRHVFSCDAAGQAVADKEDAGAWSDGRGTVHFSKKTVAAFHSGAASFNSLEYSNKLLHEILHSSNGGDNLSTKEHNDAEELDFGPASCGQDLSSDRVNLLASLCTGTPLSDKLYLVSTGKSVTAQELKANPEARAVNDPSTAAMRLADRMGSCKPRQGCMDIFTAEDGISEPAAKALCQRLHHDGGCLKAVNHHPWGQSPVVGGLPSPHSGAGIWPLQNLATQLAWAIEHVTPKNLYVIPSAYIDLFPDVRAKLESFKSASCFQAALTLSGDGALYARNRLAAPFPPGKTAIDDPALEFGASSSRFNWFSNLSDQAERAMMTCPVCDEATAQRILDVLSLLRPKFDFASADDPRAADLYTLDAVFAAAAGDMRTAWALLHKPGGFRSPDPLVLQVLPLQLTQELERTLERYYPGSDHFDCDGAGFAPERLKL